MHFVGRHHVAGKCEDCTAFQHGIELIHPSPLFLSVVIESFVTEIPSRPVTAPIDEYPQSGRPFHIRWIHHLAMGEYRPAHPWFSSSASFLLSSFDSIAPHSESPVTYHMDMQIQPFPVAQQEALRQLIRLHHYLTVIARVIDMLMERC